MVVESFNEEHLDYVTDHYLGVTTIDSLKNKTIDVLLIPLRNIADAVFYFCEEKKPIKQVRIDKQNILRAVYIGSLSKYFKCNLYNKVLVEFRL